MDEEMETKTGGIGGVEKAKPDVAPPENSNQKKRIDSLDIFRGFTVAVNSPFSSLPFSFLYLSLHFFLIISFKV